MPKIRPKTTKKTEARGDRPHSGPAGEAQPEAFGRRPACFAEIGEIVRKRAEAEAAIAEARKSHERLREAIDILPQGIVFLDAEGRYILWNKKYSEIYSRSSDLFEPGARLQDTIRDRRRARRLSRSGRPRGRMDRRAARQAVPARRTP